ncbi:MAG: hypothetical protein N2C14_30210, partial [Planctomycetales bacterium]
ICGASILQASVEQTRMFSRLAARKELSIKLIGVGGVGSGEHARAYLEAGAESVQVATAALIDPGVGLKIRRELA